MVSTSSRRLALIAGVLLLFLSQGAAAQDDPDPNSPTPILLSQRDSTRALAVADDGARKLNLDRIPVKAFAPDSVVNLFVRNLDLMPGEGANAFRVYAEDAKGRTYRFPVLDIRKLSGRQAIYSVSVQLTDELKYWDSPRPVGDLLVRLTWRGLSSNRVKLGLGRSGGPVHDDQGEVPTPLGSIPEFAAQSIGPAPETVGYRWSGDRMRFLQQATFGATRDLDHRVRRIGIRTYLAEQLDAPYPSLSNPYPDLPQKNSDVNNSTNGCGMFASGTLERRICQRDHYTMYPIQAWFFREAFYGEPQLRHRVAWALSQIWVVSGTDTQQSAHMLDYYKILGQNAFGNYRTLMKEMTLNAAMGNYLDMVRSTRNNPNENYPREILQLFSVGLFMLNQDGTLQRDTDGNPIPTYDQADINNFTKVFTGWAFCNTTCPNSAPGIVNYRDPMILNQNNHDVTAKTLLSYPGAPNTNIAANLNGNTEIDLALDNIFHHPNVGPFVGRLLIQHLVTSDPTPAYVGRVAAVFNNNGSGVRGDLKAVVRAILLDPEARGDFKTDPNFGKLREPVQFMTNILKAFNVKSADRTQQSDGVVQSWASRLTQNPFYSPTVFNYYPPDYVIPGTALNGPEFALMTTNTTVQRINFVTTFVNGVIPVDENNPRGTALDMADMQALAVADPTGNLVLDELNTRLMHGQMSPQMRAAILPAFVAVSPGDPLTRARAAIRLVSQSSQFQVQR